MLQPKREQGIRLLSRSTLAREIGAFLVDRKAQGLSPGAVEFYRKKLTYLRDYLERRGVSDVQKRDARCAGFVARTDTRRGDYRAKVGTVADAVKRPTGAGEPGPCRCDRPGIRATSAAAGAGPLQAIGRTARPEWARRPHRCKRILVRPTFRAFILDTVGICATLVVKWNRHMG